MAIEDVAGSVETAAVPEVEEGEAADEVVEEAIAAIVEVVEEVIAAIVEADIEEIGVAVVVVIVVGVVVVRSVVDQCQSRSSGKFSNSNTICCVLPVF